MHGGDCRLYTGTCDVADSTMISYNYTTYANPYTTYVSASDLACYGAHNCFDGLVGDADNDPCQDRCHTQNEYGPWLKLYFADRYVPASSARTSPAPQDPAPHHMPFPA